MTSQGTPGGRFSRAVKQRNLWGAEMALREMPEPSLLLLLDYLDLLADLKPEKLPVAAMRWHSRLERDGAATLDSGSRAQEAAQLVNKSFTC